MPRHRGPPGQGRPRWGWEQRLDSFLRVPSLRLLSMGLALTLALSDPWFSGLLLGLILFPPKATPPSSVA